MTKILILGDVHGNTYFIEQKIIAAAQEGCTKVFQVGDWGLQFPGYEKFNAAVNKQAKESGIDVYFIRGNHDGTDTMRKYMRKNMGDDGFCQIDTNLYYVPDGTTWEWEGVKFLGVGGAISVDKKWRTPMISWWPDEDISVETMEKVDNVGKVDILLTHDGPTMIRQVLNVPVLDDQHLELESYAHGMLINDILDITKPTYHFFGHWHHYAQFNYKDTKCILLNRDGEAYASAIIDLEDVNAGL